MPDAARSERSSAEAEALQAALPAQAQPPATVAQLVLNMQAAAGNRATAEVLARWPWTKTTPPPAPPKTVSLADLVAKKDIAGIVSMGFYFEADALTRRHAIELILAKKKLSDAEKVAIARLWSDHDDKTDVEMYESLPLWFKCVDAGVAMEQWTVHDEWDLWLATQPGVITEHQAKRVKDAVNKLTRSEYKTLRLDLWLTSSRMEKAFIVKALAAGRKMADVDKFSDAIRWQDEKWMLQHLNVVQENTAAGKTGAGIAQQWQMSCGPTSVEVLHAQTDPIFALKVTGHGDVSAIGKNPFISKEQGDILKGQGSVPTPIGTAGTGAWVETDLNALKSATGITYKFTSVTAVLPKNAAGSAVDLALKKIKGWLAEGLYIPIVIGGAPNQTAHYNVILRYDPKNGFLVHDPAQRYSGWVTTKMFLDNNCAPPLAWKLLAGYDEPTKIKPPPNKPATKPKK